jgi:hypothetical protein
MGKKRPLTGGAHLSGRLSGRRGTGYVIRSIRTDPTAWGRLLRLDTDGSQRGSMEAAVVGELTWEGGGSGEVVQAAAEARLGHLPQELSRGMLGSTGSARWSAEMSSPSSSN